MKQIINNKLYDTDKARFLCERWNMLEEKNPDAYIEFFGKVEDA